MDYKVKAIGKSAANRLQAHTAMRTTGLDLIRALAANKDAIMAPFREAEALKAAGKTLCIYCRLKETSADHGRFCSEWCRDGYER